MCFRGLRSPEVLLTGCWTSPFPGSSQWSCFYWDLWVQANLLSCNLSMVPSCYVPNVLFYLVVFSCKNPDCLSLLLTSSSQTYLVVLSFRKLRLLLFTFMSYPCSNMLGLKRLLLLTSGDVPLIICSILSCAIVGIEKLCCFCLEKCSLHLCAQWSWSIPYPTVLPSYMCLQ